MAPLLLLQNEVHQELVIPGIEGVVQQYAWLLLGAVLVGMLARRVNIPYAVALVIGGPLVEETHVAGVSSPDPGMVLFTPAVPGLLTLRPLFQLLSPLRVAA